MNKIANISSYKFVSIPEDELPKIRKETLLRAQELDLKGTILLSPEGINHFLSGDERNIKKMHEYLTTTYPYFSELHYKYSYNNYRPFNRMLVKIKKEIIPMGIEHIDPEQWTAPYVDATTLKEWYDENKDMVILDTRNDYEIRLGAFKNAVDLNIKTFKEFDQALDKLEKSVKNKTVVTYCTGGIRCEKAAALMMKKGFKNVYQLDGGILKYFEKLGGQHYNGECFVFDLRVAVNPELKETQTIQCYACQEPISVEEQKRCNAVCPYCKDPNVGIQIEQNKERLLCNE